MLVNKIKVMVKKIDFKSLVVVLVSFGLGIGTMSGATQDYIHFSSVDSEMFFAMFTFVMGFSFIPYLKK